MNICIITEYFPSSSLRDIRGGVEMVAYYEAKFLAQHNDITVITSYEIGTEKEDSFDNIKLVRCGKRRKYTQLNAFFDRFSFMRGAYSYAQNKKFDIIVGFSLITYWVAWKIAKKLNIPCAIRYNDVLIGKWFKNFGLTSIIGELWERYILTLDFDAIIAISEYTAVNLKKIRTKHENIHVVYIGGVISQVNFDKSSKKSLVCVSRLVKYKQIDNLIHAIKLLLDEFPDIECQIVGSGNEMNSLKQLTSSLGIDKHITFLGFVKEHEKVLESIKKSYIFCLPSALEGFGLVLVEAMACGTPYVASNLTPLMEITDKKGGLFYECGHIEELADKIKLLLEDDNLHSQLLEEGLLKSKDFNWEKTASETEIIYKNLVKLKI